MRIPIVAVITVVVIVTVTVAKHLQVVANAVPIVLNVVAEPGTRDRTVKLRSQVEYATHVVIATVVIRTVYVVYRVFESAGQIVYLVLTPTAIQAAMVEFAIYLALQFTASIFEVAIVERMSP